MCLHTSHLFSRTSNCQVIFLYDAATSETVQSLSQREKRQVNELVLFLVGISWTKRRSFDSI